MPKERRVRRIDCNPPEEYRSIVSASAHTGVSHAALRSALDTGVFCGGVWESLDKSGVIKAKADGVEYPSLAKAAIAIGCDKASFTRYRRKNLKQFTVKGHQIEIL